jgi:tryptophan synthase alpha chain
MANPASADAGSAAASHGPDPSAMPRAAIAARRSRGERALVPFLTAGYPDWDTFDAAVLGLAGEGADLLELGIPFSDPLADGPTIQAASQRVLDAGVTVEEILRRVEARRAAWGIPVVVMTYANPILAMGAERFAARARAAGIGGILVSDLPPEELPEVWAAFRAHGLETVVLVAPNTAAARLPLLAAAATGYVYCLTRTGVTGKGGAFSANLAEQAARVRAHTSLPVVAGFGIRGPGDARALGDAFDGVVVGARWLELLAGEDRAAGLAAVRELARGLRRVLDGSGEAK